MLLLEIAQIATGLSLVIATATFVATQVDRAKKTRQERILRWQRVIVYNLVTNGANDFDNIRDAYLARSQQFTDVQIPKSELQDSTLQLLLMQLISDNLIVYTEHNTYVPNVARDVFPDENFKQLAVQDMQRRFGTNKLLSNIYELLDQESGRYTIDQMYRRLASSVEGFTFDDFNIQVREMIADRCYWSRRQGLAAQQDSGRATEPPLRRKVSCRRKIEMSPGVQSRGDTRVLDGHRGARLGLHLRRGVEQRISIAALDRD
jgi:hypothetical protein